MNIVDTIIALILSFGFFRGFIKGFIIEIASLASLFLGLLGAIKFSSTFENLLNSFLNWNIITIQIVSYVIIFIIIVYVVSFFAKSVTKILGKASLGLLNKFLGALFGMFKWAILLSAILFFILRINELITILDDETIKLSYLCDPILQLGELLFNWGDSMSSKIPKKII